MERTLSKNEAKVILDLESRSADRDARRVALGARRVGELHALLRLQAGPEVVARAAATGLFRRVPAARGREGVADANPLTAGAVLVSPSFFSFGTAAPTTA